MLASEHDTMKNINQILFSEGDTIPHIPTKFQTEYPHIVTDPGIHAGWPHIKGSRILATDIFQAQVKRYSYSKMIMDFKDMGITVTEKELYEAFMFTLAWIQNTTDGKETKKAQSKKPHFCYDENLQFADLKKQCNKYALFESFVTLMRKQGAGDNQVITECNK